MTMTWEDCVISSTTGLPSNTSYGKYMRTADYIYVPENGKLVIDILDNTYIYSMRRYDYDETYEGCNEWWTNYSGKVFDGGYLYKLCLRLQPVSDDTVGATEFTLEDPNTVLTITVYNSAGYALKLAEDSIDESKCTDVTSQWYWEGGMFDQYTGERLSSDLRMRSKYFVRDDVCSIRSSGNYFFMVRLYDRETEEYIGSLGKSPSSIYDANLDYYAAYLNIYLQYADLHTIRDKYKFRIILMRMDGFWSSFTNNDPEDWSITSMGSTIPNDFVKTRIELNEVLPNYQILSDMELIHANPTSTGQYTVREKVKQFSDIEWSPIRDMPRADTDGTTYFTANETYNGIPYGANTVTNVIGVGCSFESFMTMLKNPNGRIYTVTATNSTGWKPYYGVMCSTLVSQMVGYEAGILTTQWDNMNELQDDQGIYNLEIGTVYNLSDSHMFIISDLLYDTSGTLQYIEVTEGLSRARSYQFSAQVSGPRREIAGAIRYLCPIEDIVSLVNEGGYSMYKTPSDIMLKTELIDSPILSDDYVYNTDLMLDRGNRSNYRQSNSASQNEAVNITVYDSVAAYYPYLLIYKDDELLYTYELGVDITGTTGYSDDNIAANTIYTLDSLDTGYYKACLSTTSSGNIVTDYVYWCCIYNYRNCSAYDTSTGEYTVDWVTSLPLYNIFMAIGGYSLGYEIYPTEEEIAAGTMTFTVPTEIATKATQIGFATKSDYGYFVLFETLS